MIELANAVLEVSSPGVPARLDRRFSVSHGRRRRLDRRVTGGTSASSSSSSNPMASIVSLPYASQTEEVLDRQGVDIDVVGTVEPDLLTYEGAHSSGIEKS